MKFGEAIDALKEGKMVRREGWISKSLFVFRQVPATISYHLIANMQSLPKAVKDACIKRGNDLRYNNQLATVGPANDIQGYSPSEADALAEDWVIYES